MRRTEKKIGKRGKGGVDESATLESGESVKCEVQMNKDRPIKLVRAILLSKIWLDWIEKQSS